MRDRAEPTPRDVVENLFPVDGPHSPELTSAAADCLTRLVRFLNYATGADRATTTTPYPATVYDVIGSVQRAASMFDQTLRQSGQRLADLAGAPNARLSQPLGDPRWPDQATPQATAEAAALELRQARASLHAAERALSRAHVYAGRLGLDLPDDDPGDPDES